MNNPIPSENERYTYQDYLEWPGPERYELIDGEAWLMAAPSFTHQRILGEISRQVLNFLDGKRCMAIFAPFDVRIFEQEGDEPWEVDTVVQPDLVVVCDTSKLDDRGLRGAPDMAVEILSPSSKRRDRETKLDLYRRAGVKEYWIIDPERRQAEIFVLTEKGTYRSKGVYSPKDVARVDTIEGCYINLTKVFPD